MPNAARYIGILFVLLIGMPRASRADSGDLGKPLWEYGFGVGYVQFEQYPSSNQFSYLTLPFPTFQYRGEVLRADDRDGARAYFLREGRFSVQFAAGGNPPLDSSMNEARHGMADLPLMLAFGPQLVYRTELHWEIKLALLEEFGITLQKTKTNGQSYRADFIYRWDQEPLEAFGILASGRITYEAFAGSAEYLSNYFEVTSDEARTDRPVFAAKSGILSNEISYFESLQRGRAALYFGVAYTDYSGSVNRESPLHKSDHNTGVVLGLTYILGESYQSSVPVENTEGVLNRLRRQREGAPNR